MRQKPQTYAITAVAHGRRSVFQLTAIAELFLATIFRYRDAGNFQLHAFVVMPDHVHLMLTPAPDKSVERCVQLIKGGFSFAVRKELPGEIWQPGYHAHRITDDDDMRNQLAYILSNPERKHLIDLPHIHTHEQHRGRIDPIPSPGG